MSSHKELDDFIENVYGFKKVWKEKCSKYNVESQPHILPPVKRIIVIGDIHGDKEMTLESLKIAKLIDNNGEWIGGDTVVVQVGDQVDRCRYTGIPCNLKQATDNDEGNDWEILQYFTKLHKQAREVGGAVYSLIGNHELMNVSGDFRYVSYEGLREFDNYKKPDGTGFKDGKEARKWAFDLGNPISEFLACTRQVALIIGSNLFVHGGILPQIAKKYSVKTLNELMSLYLFDMLKDKSKYYDVFNAADVSPFALFASAHNLTNSSLHKISNPTVPSNPLPFCRASTYPTGICFPPPTVNTNKASPFESCTTVNPLFNSS